MKVNYYDMNQGTTIEGESDLRVVEGAWIRVNTELYPAATVFRSPEEDDLLREFKANRLHKRMANDKFDKEMYEILNEKSRRRARA